MISEWLLIKKLMCKYLKYNTIPDIKKVANLMERKIIILLLLFAVFTVRARESESLNIFTDRDIYISGETLLLKVFTPKTGQSGTVNIDLISCTGVRITGIILEIIDYQADGFIYLPDSLSSSCYMLRTSTRTDKTITTKVLYIANRFNGITESDKYWQLSGSDLLGSKVAKLNLGKSGKFLHASDTLATKIEPDIMPQVNAQIAPLKAQAERLIESLDSIITAASKIPGSDVQHNITESIRLKQLTMANLERISGSLNDAVSGIIPFKETEIQKLQVEDFEKEYKPRVKGHAIVHLPEELLSKLDGNLSVSIAGTIPEITSATFMQQSASASSQVTAKEGIILDGKVTDLKTAQPFKNALVYLSVPDSVPGFQYYITGEDGRFYFQIRKCYGKIPVVIQCFDMMKSRLLKIVINDQENLKNGLAVFESKTFPAGFRKSVEKNRDAVTLRKIFNQQEIAIQAAQVIKKDSYPFYGVPTKIVDPQLFVDLPDFNEISRELLPGVKFRTYNRLPTLQVFNTAQLNYFDAQPLLLLDGIPVRDLDVIKGMGTKDIDRIEICQSERFFGDLIFPGVVALYTLKADYSRIKESDELIKLNLNVIQLHANLNLPSEQRLNDPDLRQVLLWQPSLKPMPTMVLDFQTSDIRGTFKLSIHGKTRDGSIFNKEQTFEVN